MSMYIGIFDVFWLEIRARSTQLISSQAFESKLKRLFH